MSTTELAAGSEVPYQRILAELRRHTGIDFSGYRRATVERRIANRMMSLGVTSHEAYAELLARSGDEAQRLLDRIAIKVSRFYRNAQAFDRLRRDVVPQLCYEARGRPLRVWSAGCGFGEEAYTLAMVFDHAGGAPSVEATDIDPAALAAGARGCFPAEAARDLPADLATRYLMPAGGTRVCVQTPLRARVRFMRHDLLFSALPRWQGFDLVSCRNVVIYLQKDRREEVLGALLSALRPGGVLLLGEAEWPSPAILSSLDTLAPRERIFRAREAA